METDRKRTVTDSNKQKNYDELNIACNEILKLIKENKNITQKEITNKLGYGRTKVTGNMRVLVEKGYIKREGSDKAGYWKILK